MDLNKIFQQHPTIVHQNNLLEICKPLTKLNIVYFAHVNIDGQNQMSTIGLGPKYFEEYFKNNFQLYDLHQGDLHNYNSHIIWDTIKITHNTQTNKMREIFNQFNYGHTFTIIRSLSSNSRDYYHFSVNINDNFMNDHYLEILNELYNFINYFTYQIQRSKELKLAYQIKFPLKNKEGNFFYERFLNQKVSEDFRSSMFTTRFYVNHIKYLTKKELDCLNWISKGKIEEEIAIILQISRRTVKEHIKNIKLKLKCKTLFQLGMVYSKLFVNRYMPINF